MLAAVLMCWLTAILNETDSRNVQNICNFFYSLHIALFSIYSNVMMWKVNGIERHFRWSLFFDSEIGWLSLNIESIDRVCFCNALIDVLNNRKIHSLKFKFSMWHVTFSLLLWFFSMNKMKILLWNVCKAYCVLFYIIYKRT